MNNNSTKRRKLYYDFALSSEAASASLLMIIPFCASTGPHFGAASPDRYGNVMEPNRFNGVATGLASIQRRCKQAITAEFQIANFTGVVGLPRVDFLKEGSDVVVDDPTTERRPRVRVRLHIVTGGGAIRGVLYMQKQHSIEI